MSPQLIDQLYEQQIKGLPRADRLRLLARIADDLAAADASAPLGTAPAEPADDEPVLDILDLEGVGAEIWQGVDAQRYVDQLRAEWDQP